MIGSQPARRAPWTELRPTPPQPITTTLDPALTLAVLITAPMPVSTPQAISDGAVELHVLRDRDRLRGVDDDMLGEGPGAQAVDDRPALAVAERRRLVEREHLFAEDRRALGAGRAEAAVADEGRDHVVAGA